MSLSAARRGHGAARSSQRGAVAIMVAFFLILILGFAALAVDSYHLFIVRNELQNDVDAAALAGAGHLYDGTSPTPDFTTAEAKATAAIPVNPTLRGTLAAGEVEGGYWNSASGFQPLPGTPGEGDFPAVRVTVSRSAGGDGGGNPPVQLFLGGVFGLDTIPVSATATAVVVPPGVSYPGGLFPLGLTNCLFQHYWDWDAMVPEKDPLTNEAYVFKIGSAYHYEGCESGQWTSFKTDNNDVKTIRGFIDGGNPETIAIGEDTWMQPGVKAAIYNDANDCSAAGDRSCEYVTMPVIQTDDVDTHAEVEVVAFACVRILRAVGGSDKYVEVQMTLGCDVDGSGGGPYLGTVLPPKLAQ